MSRPSANRALPPLMLAAVLCLVGCPGSSSRHQSSNPTNPPDTDPASVNRAPAGSAPAASSTAQKQSSASKTSANTIAKNSEQPAESALNPPPPLPEYKQPPCPGNGYIWTPGYWAHAQQGYYWVPGAWVEAPYKGALWTPGYWGYVGRRFRYFPGYWGPHIGFYGGVNYGFGYTGHGYQGGYWKDGQFHYNRDVNNVNPDKVNHVYRFRISLPPGTRPSFNGGPGGVRARPRPVDKAAQREQHLPPMRTQIELREAARSSRGQFAQQGHKRPAKLVEQHPVAADHLGPLRGVPARRLAPPHSHVAPAGGNARPPQK